jgi:hypothetical protein
VTLLSRTKHPDRSEPWRTCSRASASVCATEVGASDAESDWELSMTLLSFDGVGGASAVTVGSEGVVDDGVDDSVLTSEPLRVRSGWGGMSTERLSCCAPSTCVAAARLRGPTPSSGPAVAGHVNTGLWVGEPHMSARAVDWWTPYTVINDARYHGPLLRFNHAHSHCLGCHLHRARAFQVSCSVLRRTTARFHAPVHLRPTHVLAHAMALLTVGTSTEVDRFARSRPLHKRRPLSYWRTYAAPVCCGRPQPLHDRCPLLTT